MQAEVPALLPISIREPPCGQGSGAGIDRHLRKNQATGPGTPGRPAALFASNTM